MKYPTNLHFEQQLHHWKFMGNRDETFWDVALGIARAVADLIKTWPSKEEWLDKGNTLRELKRFDDALNAYEYALRLDPNYEYSKRDKQLALEKLGRRK